MSVFEPYVSVVMPMGTMDAYVPEQLAALDALTASFPFEIVISLNSPEPAQREQLAAAVAGMRHSVRIVDSSDRRGASHARNVGAAAATASILAFCDSDDIVRADWLEKIVAGLDGYEAVGGHLEEFATGASVRGVRPPATPGELPTYLGVPYLVSANFAIQRAWYEKVQGFDETLHRCEDIAIGWDLLRAGARLGFVADAIIDYRTRDGLLPLLKQHYHYGRGMSEVIVRRGVPTLEGAAAPAKLFAANKQAGGKGSVMRFVRRSFIAVGRGHGLLTERDRRRAEHASSTVSMGTTNSLHRVSLFGLDFIDSPSIGSVIADLLDPSSVRPGRAPFVLTPNVDHVLSLSSNEFPDAEQLCRRANWILPDGQPIVWTSRLVAKPLASRLPGSTLVHELFPRLVAEKRPLLVVTSSTEEADALATDVDRGWLVPAPMLQVNDGAAFDALAATVLERATAVRPEFVFVNLSHPKAPMLIDRLIAQWPSALTTPVFLGVGASFEMHYGIVRRAPGFVQRIGMEWFFRFIQEPRRLFHRYFVRGPRFFKLALAELGKR
jgi:N-acetylglucosaminyldiphosphoundecaprenol N-acetyl-beta-D-mannosaminyltransferase